MNKDGDKINVVDIGTGSGAIVIGVAKNTKKNSKINFFAIDNSEYAIKFCKQNIRKYMLDDRITIIKSDLLNKFHLTPHLIFANLPYIEKNDIANLQKEIRIAEPSNALNGGKDGLEIISKLLKQLSTIIDPNTCTIMLEIGVNQDKKLLKIIESKLPNFNVRFINDYQKIKRIAVIQNKN
jgi:release factor glutamine methyltransferase